MYSEQNLIFIPAMPLLKNNIQLLNSNFLNLLFTAQGVLKILTTLGINEVCY